MDPTVHTPKPAVLLVDDEPGVRRSLQLIIQGSGFRVRSYGNAGALLADSDAVTAHAIVADFRLPDLDGVQLLERLRAAGFTGQAILVTGFGTAELEERARSAGYDRVLEKPLPDRILREAMHRLIA